MTDLSNVKVGDYLYSRERFSDTIRLWKVDRRTATQIVCGDKKFNLQGCVVPRETGWYRTWVNVCTPEIMRECKEQNLRARIKEYVSKEDFKKLPLESLELIFNSLPISKLEKDGAKG
jgi:hypothetical protein